MLCVTSYRECLPFYFLNGSPLDQDRLISLSVNSKLTIRTLIKFVKSIHLSHILSEANHKFHIHLKRKELYNPVVFRS